MLKGPIKRVFSIFELLMEIKMIGLPALLRLYFKRNPTRQQLQYKPFCN